MLRQYRCWDMLRPQNWRRNDTGLTLAHVGAGIVPVMIIGYFAHGAIKRISFPLVPSSSAGHRRRVHAAGRTGEDTRAVRRCGKDDDLAGIFSRRLSDVCLVARLFPFRIDYCRRLICWG